MITYDVDYNIIEGYTLEECFINAKQLRKYKMPRIDLTELQVNDLLHEIPGSLWNQFRITEYDNSEMDAYRCPEIIKSTNLAEWVYD